MSGDVLTQWGLGVVIGLAMAGALLRAFFSLLADNRAIRRDLVERHLAQEERFFLGLLDCINQNTAILEKVEESLQTISESICGDEE